MKTTFYLLAILLFVGCKPGNKTILETENQNQWEKIGPGGGGSTFIPTFSYHSHDKFLVRCDMTGSYITNDGGISYRQINFANGASDFTFDPSDLNIVYIASAVLNKSEDGGKTWKTIFPHPDEITKEVWEGDHANYRIEVKPGSAYESGIGKISNLLVHPADSKQLFFSMGRFFFYPVNQGTDWKKLDCKSPVINIFAGKKSPENEVFIFTSDAIFIFNKITESLTKQEIPKEITPVFSVAAGTVKNSDSILFYAMHHITKSDNQFETENSEIWKSNDLGKSWIILNDSVITNSRTGKKPGFSAIACAEYDAAQAWVICSRYEEKDKTGASKFWYGALKTNNSGASWDWAWKGGGGSGQYGIQDAGDAENLSDAWVQNAFGNEFIQLIDVGVAPENGNIAVVTDWYRTMKTTDGGKTWNEIYSQKQSDGSYTSRGLDVTTAYGVHFDPFDKNHIAVSYTDIGFHHSFNGGKSWERAVNGVPQDWVNTCYWVVFDPEIKGKVWSAWSNLHDFPRGKMTRNPKWKQNARGGICVSEDGGKNWNPVTSGMGFDSPATCIVIDPKSIPGKRTLYTTVFNKGVFKSVDDGKTWELKNKGIGKNTAAFELTLTPSGDLFLVVSPSPAYLNGEKGKEIFSGGVYKSADGAESWKELKIAEDFLFPNGIEYDRTKPGKIYLACWSDISLADLVGRSVIKNAEDDKILKAPGGVFVSEDGGETWKSCFGKDKYVYDVTADEFHSGRLYVNTFNNAAYRSDDSGNTWEKLAGYDFHWGHRAIIDPNDTSKIYLTTFGSSVWHGTPKTEE